MNLEGLLTYFGLLAAAVAIMGPVQRRALLLFVPKWLMPICIFVALLFLVIRDTLLGIRPPFGWRLEMVTYLLTLGAFVLPVVALHSNRGFCSEPSAYCTQIADFEACLYSNRGRSAGDWSLNQSLRELFESAAVRRRWSGDGHARLARARLRRPSGAGESEVTSTM